MKFPNTINSLHDVHGNDFFSQVWLIKKFLTRINFPDGRISSKKSVVLHNGVFLYLFGCFIKKNLVHWVQCQQCSAIIICLFAYHCTISIISSEDIYSIIHGDDDIICFYYLWGDDIIYFHNLLWWYYLFLSFTLMTFVSIFCGYDLICFYHSCK